MQVEQLDGGVGILGDSTDPEVIQFVYEHTGGVPLLIADPPYGNIVSETWDRVNDSQDEFVGWMLDWTRRWATALLPGGAMYVWGGYGRIQFRPYFDYLARVETADTGLEMANFITWSKRRAYGIQWGYLQTREDVAYFVNGNHKQPRVFNVPLLDKERGYAGYNAKYPAKSKFLRRTSVWTDITEMLRGKDHPTQKPVRLHQIMVEASSLPGDWVVDPFAGFGTTGFAAREADRRFVVIENDPGYAEAMFDRLR